MHGPQILRDRKRIWFDGFSVACSSFVWFALFPSTLLFLVRYSFHVAAEPGWNTTTSLPTPCVLRHTHATTAYLVYVFDAVPPSRMAFPHGTFALRDSVDANWQRSDTKPSKKKIHTQARCHCSTPVSFAFHFKCLFQHSLLRPPPPNDCVREKYAGT